MYAADGVAERPTLGAAVGDSDVEGVPGGVAGALGVQEGVGSGKAPAHCDDERDQKEPWKQPVPSGTVETTSELGHCVQLSVQYVAVTFAAASCPRTATSAADWMH